MSSYKRILDGQDYWDECFPLHITREREAFALPLHLHTFIELQYVAEGKGFHYIGDDRIVVEKGDLFMIPIGTEHVYRPSSPSAKDELIVYNCLFDERLPRQLALAYPLPAELSVMLAANRQRYLQYKDLQATARQLFEAMHQEYCARQPGFEAVLYAQLTRLLVYLYRLETSPPQGLPEATGIGAILAYIDRHYHQSITLTQAAQLISTSSSNMQKQFKQVTGQTFTEYIQNVRIKKSIELLGQSVFSIQEIANRVGYRDLKFFHALFKKKTGYSPARYRARIKSIYVDQRN
ncbi:AraC family transcriptional regulator [Paenibacillus daejeonensis]|uniref:AraC family transcriptional regulator n=1 Tax=Paenibacillus daejeonensis TaxID=135193 RepID=UPI00035F68BE|nr:AraC family transcriptional regulator [Paenibacillus daejeonensis]